MRIAALNIYDGWVKLMREVMARDIVAPVANTGASVRTHEVIGTSLCIEDALANIIHHPLRDINPRFMVAEWLWILAGRADVRTISEYNKQIAQFSDDGVKFAGAYGPRLECQWDYVIETLKNDPASRRAVASIWSPNPRPTKDYPCTLNAQFIVRDRKLHSIWTMRSNDLWLGFPYDFFNFSMLTNNLAAELGYSVGSLTLNTGSSHIYEQHWNLVRALVGEYEHGLRTGTPEGRSYRSPQFTTPLCAETVFVGVERQCRVTGMLLDELHYAMVLLTETKAEAFQLLPKE